ncbi:hypothetical protein [Micromonospora sp. WMMA1947]|uniref:hypothetical protein n=1 Tax=Micromonospora sp. WMMA1947 TaxID=3015163 RepID=UPI00248B85E5|nr:hypothetical protein [Micromonospora sp. WMMA1947]WBC10852.1 hypothetical protein O7604_08240 [Micromonospora sp. WMMA1947]
MIVPPAEGGSRETEYLLRDPSNAAAMRRSMAELEKGDAAERNLTESHAVADPDDRSRERQV